MPVSARAPSRKSTHERLRPLLKNNLNLRHTRLTCSSSASGLDSTYGPGVRRQNFVKTDQCTGVPPATATTGGFPCAAQDKTHRSSGLLPPPWQGAILWPRPAQQNIINVSAPVSPPAEPEGCLPNAYAIQARAQGRARIVNQVDRSFKWSSWSSWHPSKTLN